MNTDDPNLPPPEPPLLPPIPPTPPLAAIPIGLSYSSLQPFRPGIITATGVIGIIIAVLGLLVAAYGALTTSFLAYSGLSMQWQSPGALAVSLSDAIVGVALAITLLTGSSGLLRQRPWSRRTLIWWSGLYLTSVLVFLLLQILIVVPSQTAMFTRILATVPAPAPATSPAAATTTPGSTSFIFVASPGGATTTFSAPIAAAGPNQAQMATFMSYGYVILAFGKAIISIIFPIAVLIVMQLKSVRSALQAEPAV